MTSSEAAEASSKLPRASQLATSRHSRTFSKGLRVLEALAEADGPLTAQEIARVIGADRAIVYRMLHTLRLHGLLSESDGEGRFSLGLQLLTLARHIQFDVREIVTPVLEDLAEAASCTAILGVLEDSDIVCFASVEPRNTNVRVRYREGSRHPLGTGATGLAIDMLRPETASEAEPLQKARRLGYAVSVETLEAGTAAVGAPIAAPVHGRLASVGLIFAKSDERDVPAMGQQVIAAARRISDALAH